MASSETTGTVKTVGYIGLGNAGYSMASNLPKNGFNVVVYDLDVEKVQKAAKEWANTVASDGSAESFKNCDMIVTMLPQGKVVREVIIGKGIAKALRPGKHNNLNLAPHMLSTYRHHHRRHLILLALRHAVSRQ